MVRHKMISLWWEFILTSVVSILVKTMFSPTWKLAFNNQSVEPNSYLWVAPLGTQGTLWELSKSTQMLSYEGMNNQLLHFVNTDLFIC